MMAKKGVDSVEDLEHVPDHMRMFAMQAMHEGKPFPPHMMGRPGAPMTNYGSGSMMMAGDNNSGKVGKSKQLTAPFLHSLTCLQ